MIKGIMDWIDDRSGISGLVKEALYEKVPGGARWRYVWGSWLTFVFFTQVVTGTLLYSGSFTHPVLRLHGNAYIFYSMMWPVVVSFVECIFIWPRR